MGTTTKMIGSPPGSRRPLPFGSYIPAGRATGGRRNPASDARAVFDGVRWCEVPDFHWSRLTAYASEMSMAALGTGVGVVNGRLVQFAGH